MKSASKTFYVDTENGEVEVTVNATFEYDSDYGADADGNRGRGVWFMEGYEIEDLESYEDKDEVEKAVERKIDSVDFDL